MTNTIVLIVPVFAGMHRLMEAGFLPDLGKNRIWNLCSDFQELELVGTEISSVRFLLGYVGRNNQI
jgi:hypothetical protein